jgi:capsular exopolysaccharide synthesis family protein
MAGVSASAGSPDRFDRARGGENLTSALQTLRRRWFIVTILVMGSMVVLAVTHERKAKSYAATASVTFQSGTLSDAALQVTPQGTGEPQREANTEVLVAHSAEVAKAVAKQLGLPQDSSALLSTVKVEAAPSADILNIIATTGSPGSAARLANAFAEQYIAFRVQSQLAGINTAQSNLQQQIAALPASSAERATLSQSLQRLGELRAVAGGGADIIGRATPPTSPTGGGLSTSIIIGLLVGLGLAFSVVFLLESLDRRVKSIDEFEREYRVAALAGVPSSSFRFRRASERTETLEPYRILRSALDFAAVTRRLDRLMVTSAIAGEGKTTVAVDLAHTVALTGRRVVLVELDLRRPTFSTHFDLEPGRGVTMALTSGMSPTELLIEPFDDLPSLSILPAGRIPHNPSELLGSPRIAEILAELARGQDLLVIDAAPLIPVADAQVLLNNPEISASIVVSRMNYTKRDEVRAARAILDRHMAEPVGIVVTGLRETGRYGYDAYLDEATDGENIHTLAANSDLTPRAPSGKAQSRRSGNPARQRVPR